MASLKEMEMRATLWSHGCYAVVMLSPNAACAPYSWERGKTLADLSTCADVVATYHNGRRIDTDATV